MKFTIIFHLSNKMKYLKDSEGYTVLIFVPRSEPVESSDDGVDWFDFVTYKAEFDLLKKYYSGIELYLRTAVFIDYISHLNDKEKETLLSEIKKKEGSSTASAKAYLNKILDMVDLNALVKKWYDHFNKEKGITVKQVDELLLKYNSWESTLFNRLYKTYVDSTHDTAKPIFLWFGSDKEKKKNKVHT